MLQFEPAAAYPYGNAAIPPITSCVRTAVAKHVVLACIIFQGSEGTLEIVRVEESAAAGSASKSVQQVLVVDGPATLGDRCPRQHRGAIAARARRVAQRRCSGKTVGINPVKAHTRSHCSIDCSSDTHEVRI